MRPELDDINRSVWKSPRVLGIFARREGFIDRGEELVFERAARETRGQPILDIGIGAGRTVPLLRAVSTDYVGIDYLEEVVRLARSRHPGVRIERADARDLSRFADDTFALVVFSFNGIDGVAHADRRTVLAEIHRVLRSGGLFAYSTHNLDYRSAGRRPWDRDWRRVMAEPRRTISYAARLPRKIHSYRRLRGLNEYGDGWASLVAPAYDFGVVWHHVTLAEALRELGKSGFTSSVEVYGETSYITNAEHAMVHSGFDPTPLTRDSRWLYLLARKPATLAPDSQMEHNDPPSDAGPT
jgi:SAM-dependent methyltransferase